MPKLKCKHCKQRHEPFNSLDNWCKKIDCQTAKAMFLLRQKKKADEKKWKQEKKELKIKVYSKKYKGYLQDEINKLARMIDGYFGYLCIDCGKPYGKQIDAAHLHNSQGNENIRYNLHNLHSAKSDCNRWSSEHKVGYRKGIIERYDKEYLNYIDIELPKIYAYLGLNEVEVYEALAKVRKCIREFDKHIEQFNNGKEARDYFNKKIGIYDSKQ